MRAACGLAATLARANAKDSSQMSMPTADHLQRRRLLCRVERHGADARADIEKAAGERRRQPWTVSGERDNTACVLARGLAEGLKCGGVLKNLPGTPIRIVEQIRRRADLEGHIRQGLGNLLLTEPVECAGQCRFA